MNTTQVKIRSLIVRLNDDLQEDIWYDSSHDRGYPRDPQTRIMRRCRRTPKLLLKLLDKMGLTDEQLEVLRHLRDEVLLPFPESSLCERYVKEGLDVYKYNTALEAINKLIGD